VFRACGVAGGGVELDQDVGRIAESVKQNVPMAETGSRTVEIPLDIDFIKIPALVWAGIG
jgi:hypothetical protein